MLWVGVSRVFEWLTFRLKQCHTPTLIFEALTQLKVFQIVASGIPLVICILVLIVNREAYGSHLYTESLDNSDNLWVFIFHLLIHGWNTGGLNVTTSFCRLLLYGSLHLVFMSGWPFKVKLWLSLKAFRVLVFSAQNNFPGRVVKLPWLKLDGASKTMLHLNLLHCGTEILYAGTTRVAAVISPLFLHFSLSLSLLPWLTLFSLFPSTSVSCWLQDNVTFYVSVVAYAVLVFLFNIGVNICTYIQTTQTLTTVHFFLVTVSQYSPHYIFSFRENLYRTYQSTSFCVTWHDSVYHI